MVVAKNPCKDCKNRSQTCHSNCELYKKFVEDNAAMKEAIKKDNELRYGGYNYPKPRRR